MSAFVGRDPIGYAGGDGNLYRYVGNSPVNGTDPSGLKVRMSGGNVDAMRNIFGAANLSIDGNVVSFSDAQAAAIHSYEFVQATGGRNGQGMEFRTTLWKAIAAADMYTWNDVLSGRSNTGRSELRRVPDSTIKLAPRPSAGLPRGLMVARPGDTVVGHYSGADGSIVPLTKPELTWEYIFNDFMERGFPTLAIIVIGEAIPGPADEAAALRAMSRSGGRSASIAPANAGRLVHLTLFSATWSRLQQGRGG
jgi:hypothetical protein